MKNIEKFNKLTAQILTTLYENFPRKIDLEPEKFDKNMDREGRLFFIDTVMWLAENGYISYKSLDNYGNFFMTTLTEKGLMVLNAKIDLIKDKQTFGEYLKYLLQEGSVNALNEAISVIPKIVFGGKGQ